MNAIKKAQRTKDPAAQLFIIATHRDTPSLVLRKLTDLGPDFVRSEAKKRLKR